jgi:hypothetical protein
MKKPTDPMPDRKAVNLREAANIIKMIESQNACPQILPDEQTATPASFPELEPVIEENPGV